MTPRRTANTAVARDSTSPSKSSEPRGPARPTRLDLSTPIQYLRGVGPTRARHLQVLGLHTAGDLIDHYPFRHEHIPVSVPIGKLTLDDTATVVGEISRVRKSVRGNGVTIDAVVTDGTGRCRVRWYHSGYLYDKLVEARIVRLSGKVSEFRETAQFTNPKLHIIGDNEEPFAGDRESWIPVYSASAAISSNDIGRLIRQHLPSLIPFQVEILPPKLQARRKLMPRPPAIREYHQPTSAEALLKSRQRLVYEELFIPHLAVRLRKNYWNRELRAEPAPVSPELDARIRARFDFALTASQDECVKEICADLARGRPMNRLLQGDVGSGKTAVAIHAALAVIAWKRQVLFVAPTEILARQHYATINRYLSGSKVRLAYLSGATSAREKSHIVGSAVSGSLDLLIGTHAALEQQVRFPDLGLVVVDEQHRFGVEQRAQARSKAHAPHVLVMSATPIPRTLAMALFGDLDVSTIRELPPGRSPILTRVVSDEAVAFDILRERVHLGEQAYIVYPRIEEDEKSDLKAAKAEFERLSSGLLKGVAAGLLHGRMPAKEKTAVMSDFKSGRLSVLVSTTVVEVGVDVPNATMMVIHHADRYGLSQLHQLRGRVGRGSKRSMCLLVADPKRDSSRSRLAIMERTQDGFEVAEEDLRLRGPGELLGTQQHGFPEFRVANLASDGEILQWVLEDGERLLKDDGRLQAPEHRLLRAELLRRFGSMIPFVDVA